MGFWLHRYAVRMSDGLVNSTVPDDPKGTTASGRLPPAYITREFIGPFAWSLRSSVSIPGSDNGTMMQPDIAGLKTIATVSATASPAYAIENTGIESVGGHSTYHLRLRPLRDRPKHNLRDLWVDTATSDLWKAHYLGWYTIGSHGTSPSDITSYFAPIGGYWVVTRSEWTWTNPYDFRASERYTFDVQSNAIAFPSRLPDWLFDSGEYEQHQRAKEPDLLGTILTAHSPGEGTSAPSQPRR